jgi:hypothetical protein
MTREALTLVHVAQSLLHRLLVLPFAVVFTASGLLGVYQCIGLLRDFFSGASDVTALVTGLSVTLLVLLMGGACLWIFFLPDKTLRFDTVNRRATLVHAPPPLGIRKTVSFDFAAIRPPEVVWIPDSDTRNGGCWKLELTLPNDVILTQSKPHWDSEREKAFAQAWCDDIQAAIGEKSA